MAKLKICRTPVSTGNNKLAEDALEASTKSNVTSIPTFTVFSASTPALTQAPALTWMPALAQASAPGLPSLYTDVDPHKATKLALESFVPSQKYGQL